jgi:putative hydrolase of the HAD superfamily
MTYEAVVFDCFGVLCAEVAHGWLAATVSPAEAEDIKKTLLDAVDRGTISVPELFDRLARRTGVPAAAIEANWTNAAVIDQRVVALTQDLRQIGKVGLLTNAGAAFVRPILQGGDLVRLFDEIVVSGEIGCAKPDAAIYRTMLERLGVAPEASLMIDDSAANVAGARAIGMDGFLYADYHDLAEFLNRGGVAPAPLRTA